MPLEHGQPREVAQSDIYRELCCLMRLSLERGMHLGSAPTESRCDVLHDALQGVNVVFDA